MKTEGGGALYLPDTFLMKYFGQNTFSEQGTFRNRLVMGFDTLPRSPGNITLHQTHIYTTGLQFFAWENRPLWLFYWEGSVPRCHLNANKSEHL